jgi:hypothetical protein
MPPLRPRSIADWRDVATTAAAAALLAVFWWLAVSASLEKSQTSDELPHIGAGFVYDHFGDFRIQPENGNLPQRVFGLAPPKHAHFPMDAQLWRTSTYWPLCWDFFYAEANPTDWIVLGARSLNALFGVALGCLVFAVARNWHGRVGALIALGFFALAPNFLAHASLATSDMAAALCLTLAPWLFWRHLQRRDLVSGVVAGLASGLALVAKHNGVLLAPMYAALIAVDLWLTRRSTSLPAGIVQRAGRDVGLAVLQAAAAAAVIWAFFDFRFSARGPDMPEFERFAWDWSQMLPHLGAKRAAFEAALHWKLLPEAWLYGMGNVLAGASARPAFFAGEHSLHGWWQFFPTLFVVKTTLAMLGGLLVAVITAIFAFKRADSAARVLWIGRYAPLAVSAAVVWLTAITSHLNIGDRHILAAYPVLFVALGTLASGRVLVVSATVLLAGHAWASFAIRPHYLAAFNALCGGPAKAYRLVVDSSLDWGQDLPGLQKWIAKHRGSGEPFYLGYFGNAWPPHYGVRPTGFLTTASFVVAPPLKRFDPQPGIYAISATTLAETYSLERGPWTEKQEAEYRTLQQKFTTSADPNASPEYARYDALRFARLCKYLQRRTPDAFAGYSILIFRLTADELRMAFDGPVVSIHRMRMP